MKWCQLRGVALLGVMLAMSRMLGAASLVSLAAPSLAAAGTEVKDWSFTQGHAAYTLTGKIAPFQFNDLTCGFYFKGEGRFKYTSNNRMEFPVAAFNLKRNSFVKPEVSADALVVSDAIQEGIFLFSPGSMPTVQGGAATLASADFQSQWAFFRDLEDSPYLQKLSLRLIHSTELPYFHAQLRTKSRPWIHTVDPMDSETLDVLHPRHADWGIWTPWARISRQPIGWDIRKPKAPRFVLTDVDMEVVASEETSAHMKIRETYIPLEDGLKALDLQLFSRMMGRTAAGSSKTQVITLKSVKDSAGYELAFDHACNGALVEIPGLKAQTPVTLDFEVEGDPLMKDPSISYWVLGTWAWFPMPEDMAGQVYTMHATLKVPATIVPILGGTTIRRVKEGNLNVLETRFDQPIQFFTALAGKFELKEEVRNGITYRLAGYVNLGPGGDKLLKVTPGIVSYYESLFGTFPFKEMTFVEMQTMGSAQAPPGLILLPTEAFHPTANLLTRLYSAGTINQTVAHEISHQYWGQQVKMWSLEDQWITEGFAQYSALLTAMNMKNKGKDEYENTVKDWFDKGKNAAETCPIPLANQLAPEDSESIETYYRTYLLYDKSPCLLYAIHKDLGDDNFVRFLRSYLKTMSWHSSTTAHIPMIIKALTGKDYTKFMEDYYYGTAMPPYKK